ncbi:SMI1/KNR4 family protein [Paenibacillus doosanensis]|uniref:SMI1/KNR4 family protein n=1 Tax=Paenibacillus doosanensis TaxID=1229154 RepID=UPI00217F9EF2|nr:SMI1/KNR4 family protein [Paenibacillus doosanensis]MCS7463833.1 SMI1/KNR4 family protein [Paenibacillus doosanensis]
MKQLLHEITELLQSDLPELAASLNPPASEEELRSAEAELGFGLPPELRELYLIHNGEQDGGPGLFMGLPFLSLDGMMAEWRIWTGLENENWEAEHYSVPAGWIKEQYINRYWLPIAKDWGGNHIGIDLDPADQGRAGQVINFGRDEEVKYVIARHLSHLLQFIRDTAQEGSYTVHREEDEYVSWTFGKEGAVHFLDAIRRIELPVLEPIRFGEPGGQDAQQWFEGLDDGWKEKVIESGGAPDDFLRAKRLYLIDQGLTDTAPLGACSDVRELVLSANEIRSVEALSGCKQLKVLYLAKNPVSDLRPLQHLEQLQELVLSDTAVTDLSPLSALPKLRAVDLEHTQVRDFSPLKPVQSLRSLQVSAPDAERLRSISELRQLSELTISELGTVTSDDLAVLGKLAGLRKLVLEGADLAHLQFAESCRKLQTLVLKDSAVEDISALARLDHLRSLELSGSPDIGKLEELARSASLNKITASYRQFALLKDRFDRIIDFSSITGDMTDEESDIWYEYVKRAHAE